LVAGEGKSFLSYVVSLYTGIFTHGLYASMICAVVLCPFVSVSVWQISVISHRLNGNGAVFLHTHFPQLNVHWVVRKLRYSSKIKSTSLRNFVSNSTQNISPRHTSTVVHDFNLVLPTIAATMNFHFSVQHYGRGREAACRACVYAATLTYMHSS